MNSSTSEAVWPTPGSAHETALHIASTQAALIALVATDILAAVSSGLFTASVSMSGQLSQDVQYVMALLNQGSYSAVVTGTSLVISW
jgi:hypothetical protein